MKSDKENALTLLNDLIELAEKEDVRWRVEQVARGKGEKSIGQSFWVFHLKLLSELVSSLKDS